MKRDCEGEALTLTSEPWIITALVAPVTRESQTSCEDGCEERFPSSSSGEMKQEYANEHFP